MIGGGLAALAAASAATDAGAEVVIVVNGPIGRANSVMAQGGMQVPDDASAARAMEGDLLRASAGSADPRRMSAMVDDIPGIVDRLAAFGVDFDRDDDGVLIRRIAGGLSTARVVTAGDAIGRPLISALRGAVAGRTSHLRAEVDGLSPGHGVWDLHSEGESVSSARCVVVATGGTAFRYASDSGLLTSNPPNRNETIRPALRRLGIAEELPARYQWHPFGIPDRRRGITVPCVPESVAALPGAQLLAGGGTPVCPLPAPRGRVVEAMWTAQAAGAERVVLDLESVPSVELEAFPKLGAILEGAGRRIVVEPVVHYELTGFLTDLDCSTTRTGLYLAGELVGGIHGSERLMGMGIVDSLVHGSRAGATAAAAAQG